MFMITITHKYSGKVLHQYFDDIDDAVATQAYLRKQGWLYVSSNIKTPTLYMNSGAAKADAMRFFA